MLEIRGVSKTYPNGVRALDGVTLTIEPGLFGLLGPNGAGKSSLMRTIAALQEPDGGSVILDGNDTTANPDFLRARLGYLPQEFGVYPGVGAAELLDHIAILNGIIDHRERREQVDSVLALTNLAHVRGRAVSTFSGGMRQRFGIAQALLGAPRVIIVDEPTAGLDPEERNRFLNLLSEIGERAVVLLSTHIVEDVRDLCPRTAILAGGRVLAEGVPREMIGTLAGRLWRRTVAKAELEAMRMTHRVISTHLYAGETRIHVIADSHPGTGFEAVEPDLEDYYFSVLDGSSRERERAA